ncbi:hypothetical protein KIPB_013639, partial [Kipferlia bialata]|eukprot:g13639.t1
MRVLALLCVALLAYVMCSTSASDSDSTDVDSLTVESLESVRSDLYFSGSKFTILQFTDTHYSLVCIN